VAFKKILTVREPERDYSHRSLLDKLGIQPGQRICVLGLNNTAFRSELKAIVPDAAGDKLLKDADLIFLGASDLKGLACLKSLESLIKRNGSIWVVYPKGQKQIREADVIAAGKSAGLTDNNVFRFSDPPTALRFVIPVSRR